MSVLFGLAILPLYGVQYFYQVDSGGEKNGQSLALRLQPAASIPRNLAGNAYYMLQENYTFHFLDGPIRRIADMLTTINMKDDPEIKNLFGYSRADLPLVAMKFRLTLSGLSGDTFYQDELEVRVGLASQPGWYQIDNGDKLIEEPIASLAGEEGYIKFLNLLLSPLEKNVPLHPSGDQLAELHITSPHAVRRLNKSQQKFMEHWFPEHLFRKNYFGYQLGSCLIREKDNRLEHLSNGHMNRFRETQSLLTRAVKISMSGRYAEALPLMQEYFESMPSDRKAARYLIQLYKALELEQEAIRLTADFQPYFVSTTGIRERGRALILASTSDERLEKDQLDPGVLLRITAPDYNDTVAGDTDWGFVLKDRGIPLTGLEYALNGSSIPGPTSLPFRGRFESSIEGPLEFSVKARFSDGSYQEDLVRFNAIRVTEQTSTHLMELQAVVLDGGNPVTNLNPEDITIYENGEPRKMGAFRHNTGPKRITFLVDTSRSLHGEAIRKAQNAVAHFYQRLEPGDSMSLYTFDDKVMRLGEFTRESNDAIPKIYSLVPQMGTALHDALLTARADLMRRELETRVMVVLCDGKDTASVTRAREIKAILKTTPIRIYTVFLENGVNPFLKSIAAESGGLYRAPSRLPGLLRVMDRIHDEMNALYYLNYYSEIPKGREKDLKIKVSGGKQARWLELNQSASHY